MDISLAEWMYSEPRLFRYYRLFNDDKAKALHYYQHNLQLCAALYELLSDTEILLRNRIHASCSHYFGTTDWFDCCDIPEITDTVAMIRQRILKRDGLPSTDKIIAELNLGFWTSLFNKQYARTLWKPLRHSFSLLPAGLAKRQPVSYKLNQFRKFRNRIFHYEPIAIDLVKLGEHYQNILDILSWYQIDAAVWLEKNMAFRQMYLAANTTILARFLDQGR
ncbi:MAG: hypothetical protein GXC72_04275 [Chitinophagaceae bacterium]|nr:hypothetical protein [Chitinophagaceae bacterium]